MADVREFPKKPAVVRTHDYGTWERMSRHCHHRLENAQGDTACMWNGRIDGACRYERCPIMQGEDH